LLHGKYGIALLYDIKEFLRATSLPRRAATAVGCQKRDSLTIVKDRGNQKLGTSVVL